MDVKSRKSEQSDATRAALLDSARHLFASKGYGDTATEEIVGRAGVTRGALYHHFRDKRDLFAAVLSSLESELAARLAEAAMAGSDPLAQLRAGCAAFLDACLDPEAQRIVLIDGPAVLGWEEWRRIDAEFGLGLLREALRATVDAGLIDEQPIDPLAHLLLGALDEGAMLIARADDRGAMRAEVGAAFERLLAGLLRSSDA
jgi:AcrR family transcriptional regulator